MIYLDSIFSIGKEHDICEDYVLIGNNITPFIIVSDGCSSSDHTDIGSRLLVLHAKNYIEKNANALIKDKDYIINIFREAFIQTKSLLLEDMTLDATLLFAFIIDKEIHYFAIGDGLIVYKYKTSTNIKNLSYEKERVFYGNYHNNISRFEKYKEYNLKLNVENINLENKEKNHTENLENYILYNKISIKNLEYFFMSTDGLLSCHVDKKLSKTYFLDFLSFKNLKGEFIQRRYKMWKKKLNKEGINHADDVGIAGFSFFEED